MRNLFLELIYEFKKEVEKAVILLNQKSYSNSGFFIDSRVGYLDDSHKIQYIFHGYGCWITYENQFSVDFNFGRNGRSDRFECWSLERFIDRNEMIKEKYAAFNSYQKIEEMILLLLDNKEVIKDKKTNVYYLIEDYKNKKPISWTPISDGKV